MANLNEVTAANVRAEIARRRIRQSDVARALRVSQPAVSQRLNGHVPFTLADLEALAELLGIDVAELLQPRSLQPLGATA